MPAWSPNGKKIAFTSSTGGGAPPHIYVITLTRRCMQSGPPARPPRSRPGHKSPRRHTATCPQQDLGPGLKPNWSPNGKKIVFQEVPLPPLPGPPGGPVAVMDANGSHRHTLNQNGTAPAFSPDSKKIVYVAINPSTGQDTIAVMNADGSDQHTITRPGPGQNDVAPDWQPITRRLRNSLPAATVSFTG